MALADVEMDGGGGHRTNGATMDTAAEVIGRALNRRYRASP